MDKYKVVLTTKARKSLKSIAKYIARDNPTRAVSYTVELQEYLNKTLSIFPRAGRMFDAILHQEVRTIPYQDYVAIYTVNDSKQRINI